MIKADTVSKTMRKFWRMNLDRSELAGEAEIITMIHYEKYNRDWGSIYCYLYRFLMYELGKYAQRKMIPASTKVAGCHRVNICVSDLKYGELNPQIDCTKRVEAKDSLAKIRAQLNEQDLVVLDLMEQGLNQSEISRRLGVSRQGVSKRFVRIRKIGKEVLTKD